MKKILIFLSLLVVAFPFTGCKKDMEKITMKTTVPPNQLTVLTPSTFVLQMANAADTFQIFSWSDVDYGFKTSITYTVQVDKKRDNFSSPVSVVTVTHADSALISVGDFNKIMLGLGLTSDSAVVMQFRVKAVINPNVAPVYSTIAEATITPYQVVFPPIYMCGAATGGWSWTLYTYKELRSSSPNIYQTVAYFLNNNTFRFFKQTDWSPTSYNYPYFTGTVSSLFQNANDGDLNFLFTGTTGYYQITVDMGAKSVAMVSVPEPTLFMTGQALGGWDWTTDYVKLTWLSNGIYQATATFTNSGSASTFRFFAQQDWSPTGYNYPYFSAGTVSNLFINANDGDQKFPVYRNNR